MSIHAKKVLSTALFLFLFAGSLTAQSIRYGIGLDLTGFFQDSDIYNYFEQELNVIPKAPILYGTILAKHLRIDPECSYWRYSLTEKEVDEYKSTTRLSITHLGIGISSILKKTEQTVWYAGLKIGADWQTNKLKSRYTQTDETIETKTRTTNFFIGPCAGAEYFLSDNFSLGTEFQYIYTFIGQPKTIKGEKPQDDNFEITESLGKSKGLVYLKWYF